MRAIVLAVLACGCASYRPLPPPPQFDAVALQSRSTRLWIFHGTDDARSDGVFAQGSGVLVSIVQPSPGAIASVDAGRHWQAAALEAPIRAALFDRDLVLALSDTVLLRSEDGGRTWTKAADGIDALARGGGGRVYAAGRSKLLMSEDFGRSWQVFASPVERVRSLAADPERAGIVYVSSAGQRAPFRPTALVDQTSPEAIAAFTLIDNTTAQPAFGRGGRAWVSVDSGRTFRPTPLELDARLVVRNGAAYAVATDPMLVGAALVRRHPRLAEAAGQQLHGLHVDLSGVRAALQWPGAAKVIAGDLGPVFASTDEGITWKRTDPDPGVAIELRMAIQAERELPEGEPQQNDRGRRGAPVEGGPGGRGGGPSPGTPGEGVAPQRELGPFAQSRGGGRRGGGRRGPQPPQQQQAPGPREELVLSLFDPVRLLSRAAYGLPLAGAARAPDGSLHAYVPREEFWDRVADAVMRASESAGEIVSLTDWALSEAATTGDAFVVVRSTDGGATWSELPMPRDPDPQTTPGASLWPLELAAGASEDYLLVAGRDRRAHSWQRLLIVHP